MIGFKSMTGVNGSGSERPDDGVDKSVQRRRVVGLLDCVRDCDDGVDVVETALESAGNGKGRCRAKAIRVSIISYRWGR